MRCSGGKIQCHSQIILVLLHAGVQARVRAPVIRWHVTQNTGCRQADCVRKWKATTLRWGACTESSAMLRTFTGLARSVVMASSHTRMLSHCIRTACVAVNLPNFPTSARDSFQAVKYSDCSMMAKHVPSLLIFPESSFASHDSGDWGIPFRPFIVAWLISYFPGISELKLQKRTYQVMHLGLMVGFIPFYNLCKSSPFYRCPWLDHSLLLIYSLHSHRLFCSDHTSHADLFHHSRNVSLISLMFWCSHPRASAGENTDSCSGFGKHLMWLSIGCARCPCSDFVQKCMAHSFVINDSLQAALHSVQILTILQGRKSISVA
jgi:hypothetical protein